MALRSLSILFVGKRKMLVEIHPKKNYRTTNPINLKIYSKKRPEVSIIPLGKIEAIKNNDYFMASFFTQREGTYKISIKGDSFFEKDLFIKKQHYLSFSKEFGFFSVLFSITMIGLVLWFKKQKNH